MESGARIRGGIRSLFRRSRREADLDEEIRFHIESATQKLVDQGIPADEARRRVVLEFGGVERAKEGVRDAWTLSWLAAFLQDSRFALRAFRKRPAYAATVVITVALAIGAAGSIWNALYTVVSRPLPFADDSRLVLVQQFRKLAAGSGTDKSTASAAKSGPRSGRLVAARSHRLPGRALVRGGRRVPPHGLHPPRTRRTAAGAGRRGLAQLLRRARRASAGRSRLRRRRRRPRRPPGAAALAPLLDEPVPRRSGDPGRRFHDERSGTHGGRNPAAAAAGAARHRRLDAGECLPVSLGRGLGARPDFAWSDDDRSAGSRGEPAECRRRGLDARRRPGQELPRRLPGTTRPHAAPRAAARRDDRQRPPDSVVARRGVAPGAPSGGRQPGQSHPGADGSARGRVRDARRGRRNQRSPGAADGHRVDGARASPVAPSASAWRSLARRCWCGCSAG